MKATNAIGLGLFVLSVAGCTKHNDRGRASDGPSLGSASVVSASAYASQPSVARTDGSAVGASERDESQPPGKSVTIDVRESTLTFKNGWCYLHIRQPHAKGDLDAALLAAINRVLRTEISDRTLSIDGCEGKPDRKPLRGPLADPEERQVKSASMEPKEGMIDVEVRHQVKANENGVLCLRIETRTWRVPMAEPSFRLRAVCVNLTTGKPYEYRSLFRPWSAHGPRIDELVTRSLRAQKVKADFEPRKAYDFYLTPESLVLFNLFDRSSLGAVEASIRLARIADLANPTGPIARLLPSPLPASPTPPDAGGERVQRP